MAFLTAQNKDAFTNVVQRIVQPLLASAGDTSALQAEIDGIKSELTNFDITPEQSETITQLLAAIAAADESGEITGLTNQIAGKADQTALDALVATVQGMPTSTALAGKADQSALDAIAGRVSTIEQALTGAIAVEDIAV